MSDYLYEYCQSQPTIAGGTGPYGLYVARANKTFFCWQGFDLRPFVMAYNHITGEFSEPVMVSTKSLTDDDHGVPSLADDAVNHRLDIFWGTHGGQNDPGGGQPWATSGDYYDFRTWTEQTAIGEIQTYNMPCYTNGGEYLFVRADPDGDGTGDQEFGYYKKTGTTSWSSFVGLLNLDDWVYGHDFAVSGDGKKIYLVGNEDNPNTGNNSNHDPWLAVLDTDTDDLYSQSDLTTALSTPVTNAATANIRIEDTDDTFNSSWSIRVGVDENDLPHIVYLIARDTTSDGSPDTYEIKYATWAEGDASPTITTVTTIPTSRVYAHMEMIVRSSTDMDFYIEQSDNTIGRYHNSGSGWSTSPDETIDIGPTSPGWPKRVVDSETYEHAPNSNLELLLAQEDNEDFTNNDLKVFAWGSGSFVPGPDVSVWFEVSPSNDGLVNTSPTGLDLTADSTVQAFCTRVRIDSFEPDSDFVQYVFNIEAGSDGWIVSCGDDTNATGFSQSMILATLGGNIGTQDIGAYTTGTWAHVYALFDQASGGTGNSICRLVMTTQNGTLGDILDTGDITVSDTSSTSGAGVTLGNDLNNTGRGLGGRLSDLILLDSVPTDTEVQRHIDGEGALDVWSSYLSHWKLTGSTDTELDSGSNNNDLTKNGAPIQGDYPGADNTAPTLSGASATSTGTDSADLKGTPDDGGAGYAIVLSSGSTTPTASQVIIGLDASDTAAIARGQVASSKDTEFTISVSGLSADTTYDAHIVAEDLAGNVSGVSTQSFTTDSTTVTDTALITSATANPLTAINTATASDTATITSAAVTPLTAVETAIASDTAQITAVSATPLTATATASATDTAQITSATVTTLTASETTSAAVTDTAVITSAAATSLTAVETAIANDTAVITNAIVTTLVANENIGGLVSATATAQLTLPAPGSLTVTPQGALAYITPSAGSRLVTPNTPGSQSVTPDTPGSTTVTPRAD